MRIKRFFLGYATINNPSLGRNVEVWRLYDRRSDECKRAKPLHSFEIESLYDTDKMKPYHIKRYVPQNKDFELIDKVSSLELAIIHCLPAEEKHELLDETVELGFGKL